MNIGIYKGAAALAACDRWQQVIAGNIASASVPGFQKTETTFTGVPADLARMGDETKLGKEVRGVMPNTTASITFQAGQLRNTENETDFAIQGRGFFQIQKTNGDMGYTRDGEFHLNPERTLVNKQGLPVLGDGGPITLKAGGGNLSLNSDGVLSQGGTQVGKMQIYDFPESAKLKRVGDGLLVAEDPEVRPQAMEKPGVINGMLESSNVQPLQEMVNLITVARAYEASQKVVTANDEAMDKAIQILGNPNN